MQGILPGLPGVFIYGHTSTGKSTVVKAVLEEIQVLYSVYCIGDPLTLFKIGTNPVNLQNIHNVQNTLNLWYF